MLWYERDLRMKEVDSKKLNGTEAMGRKRERRDSNTPVELWST